jgi:hypothetical protein
MDRLEELEKLARLRAEGVLSEAQFEQRKSEILGGEGQRFSSSWSTGRRWMAIGSVAAAAVVVSLATAGLVGSDGRQHESQGQASNLQSDAPTAQAPAPMAEPAIEAGSEQPVEPACVTGECLANDVNDAPGYTAAEQRFTPAQQRLIELNADLEEACRGSSDETESERACAARQEAMDRLNAAGVCWGKEGEAYAEHQYHLCTAGSIR